MSEEHQLRDLATVPPPPFVTEETTARGLYAALVKLREWIAIAEECYDPADVAASRAQAPLNPLPDVELMAAISIWQLYRMIRAVRSIRIGYDYMKREYGDDGRVYPMYMAKLILGARTSLNFTFTTPADFRAKYAAQDAARRQKCIKGQIEEGGNA